MKWGIKGNIVFTKDSRLLTILDRGTIVCDENKIIDVFDEIPVEFEDIQITDYGNRLILPGLIDLHVHAPQYAFRGTGLDLELLDWLYTYTFPEESKFKDLDYAKKVYTKFVADLRKSPTTRASIFGTIHVDATIELMDLLEDSGLITNVGKVNMNINSPEYLCEVDANDSIKNTIKWLKRIENKYKNTKPIITPRFIPSCDAELLGMLGELCNNHTLPNQSHLSENISEIEFVRELHPNAEFYGDAYYMYNLFGGNNKTIMAHCVHPCDKEIELMKKQGVYVAHCPTSNTNLSSGIAPVRKYLAKNLNIGFGTDIGAGHTLSIFKAMADAISVSKLLWRIQDNSLKPLNITEVLYMATKGGGSFFGNVGSFERGYEMDAIILDDTNLNYFNSTSIKNRLEKIIYHDHEVDITAKYVNGKKLF